MVLVVVVVVVGVFPFTRFDFHSPLQTKQRSTVEARRSEAEITSRRTPPLNPEEPPHLPPVSQRCTFWPLKVKHAQVGLQSKGFAGWK